MPRPRSVQALLDLLQHNLVLLRAPAGFGKTFLMTETREVLEKSGESTGWLTLREGYETEVGLLTELAAAMTGDGALEPSDHTNPEATILDTIDAALGRTVVFLDGSECTFPSPIIEVLFRLIHTRPQRLTIVLAVRQSIRHPMLAELSMQGAAGVLDWHALAFETEEVAEMLPEAVKSPKAASELNGFAQGWPAIVRLGVSCLQQSTSLGGAASDDSALAAFFEGRFGPLQEFIADTVLTSLSPQHARGLKLCGLVDPLPEEMLRTDPLEGEGDSDGAQGRNEVMRQPDEAEPLLMRLGERPGWFRPHPSITAVMRHVEAQRPQAQRSQRNAALAMWFSSQRLLEQAVYHAVETENFVLAERTIREAGGVRIFLKAGFPTLNRLLSQLPASVILKSATLMLCKAVVCAKVGQLTVAREMIEAVREKRDAGISMDAPPEDLDHIDSLVAIYEDRIAEPAYVSQIEKSLGEHGPQDLWRRGWMSNHLCIAYTVLGRFEEAEAEALRSLACYREEPMRYAQIFMLTHLALISVTKGQPLTARAFTEEARVLIGQGLEADININAVVAVPEAEAHWVRGEHDQAAALIDEALPTLEKGEFWVDLLARAYHIRIRVALTRNESRAALRILDGAEQVARERHLDRLRRLVDLMRLEVMIATGLTEAAEEIARQITPMVGNELGELAPDWMTQCPAKATWREHHLALQLMAQMLWARGDSKGALTLLDRLEESAQANGATLDLTSARAHKFCFLWQIRRFQEARETFQLTVALATPQRLACVIISPSPTMAIAVRGLLRRFGVSAFSHATIEFVDLVMGNGPPVSQDGKDSDAGAPLTLLLTDYEREILQLLELGLSNKEIARRIERSEATVKYHLRRVYEKLGVRSRTMALATARPSLLRRSS